MIKVIIADDELKVCKLIEFLIDWEALEMEIVDIVHNGIDAIEAVRKHQPDIIITDIKMPGCDGLEMIEYSKKIAPDLEYIVISGYKQFEYAQKAIQFGVCNYLLKPIDKEELFHTLQKMKEKYLSRTEQLTKGERLEVFEQENKERIRRNLFKDILFMKNLPGDEINIEYINEKYQYRCQEGRFQTAAIKIDGIHGQTEKNHLYIKNKITRELQQNLQMCYDWELYFSERVYFMLLNFPVEISSIKETMNQILQNLLMQQDVLKGFQVTIGLGEQTESPSFLFRGFKAAKWALDQRLLEGTNQVIQGEYKHANDLVDSDIFHYFNKAFYEAIELHDVAGIDTVILQLENKLLARQETTGYEILQMCKEAINAYLFTLKKLEMPTVNMGKLFEQFNVEINNCGSAHETFTYLRTALKRSFLEILKEKEQMETKPIRQAKSFITEHLGDPISLEIVSDVVGFNTAYFSTMFKNQTGSTFSEYLLGKRMEKAKERLRDTNDSVAEICETVGYSDVKHFTKNFTKYTSLKPKEYRKLYS